MGIPSALPTSANPPPGFVHALPTLRMFALLGAVTLLAGCGAPALPALKPDTPPAWQQALIADANARAPDLRGWWKAFDDPTLDQLVDEALAGNLNLREAEQHINAARALARHANADFLPQVGLHTFAEPTPDSAASYFQAGFDAEWEFGFFGRATSHTRETRADLGLAQSDAQAARVRLVAETARAYIELRNAQSRLGLLEQLVENADARLALTKTRERLRLASSSELDRAIGAQATAQAALSEPRLAIERCRHQIALLLGRSEPDSRLLARAPVPVLGDLRIESAPADLLRTRPEIHRAEYAVLKAAGEAGIARSDLFPRLGLGGSLTYSAKVIGHTKLHDADGIVTFGPVIDIPLFDWGARLAAYHARNAELSASVYAYRQAVLEGVAETEIAMATLEKQRERADALKRSLDANRHAAQATATLARVGLADGLDRADAKTATVQAELEVADAEQARSLAFIALYKAMGGAPLPPPESEAAAPRSDRPGAASDAHGIDAHADVAGAGHR